MTSKVISDSALADCGSGVHNAFPCEPALLQKYDVSGPRYTSYPTAAQFSDAITASDYIAHFKRTAGSIAPLSLYVHIPFCSSICYYCACNKVVTRDHQQSRVYLDYLYRELALLRQTLPISKRPVTQMHWGGGTPTFLTDAEMTELVHALASHFNLTHQANRDYAIEIDPRTVQESRIDLLRGLGFNRISLGIQDFDEQVQVAVNRVQSYDSVARLVDYIRTSGYRSLNFDLIYGLPLQSEQSLERTLTRVIALSPDRISCYSYAHLPHRFSSQRPIDRQTLPSADEKICMLALVIRRLTAAGYLYIGMDHFVKPDDTLAIAQRQGELTRNFQGYSIAKSMDLIGVGVSSISSLDRLYVQNARTLEDYYACLDAGQLPIAHGVALSEDDVIRRDIIQQITCKRHVDMSEISEHYGIDFRAYFRGSLAELAELEQDGLVELSDDCLLVTERGYPFLRHIAMAFDQYLIAARERGVQFSKTI